MRIALFAETFLPKLDGVSITVCHVLDHLADRGHQSLLFAPGEAPRSYANTAVIGLKAFPCPRYPEMKLVPPTADVREALIAFQPDLVHLVCPASLGLAGLRCARVLGIPVVASYHTNVPDYAVRYGWGVLYRPLWAYLRWIHNCADLNLCPSRFTQAELEARGFQRVKVWKGGVDTARFHPRHRDPVWRQRLSEGHPEAPLLLFVGRLAPEKRVKWLRPVLEALPGTRLAIVGDGPQRSELENHFAGTPTVFTGYLKGDDLAHAYASADLFAFSSTTETFGNVVIEAMASGLPVVAPRFGGPVDSIRDGENGLLFEPDDLPGMISHVQRLVSNPAYAQHLGRAARAYAQTQSWDVVLDGLLHDYATLISGGFAAGTSTPNPFPYFWRRFFFKH